MIDCELKIDGKKRVLKRGFPEVLDLHNAMEGVRTTLPRNGNDFNVRVKEIHFNGEKKIEIAWSELSGDEEAEVLKAIDEHWDELNRLIDDVFAGKKIKIKRIK